MESTKNCFYITYKFKILLYFYLKVEKYTFTYNEKIEKKSLLSKYMKILCYLFIKCTLEAI